MRSLPLSSLARPLLSSISTAQRRVALVLLAGLLALGMSAEPVQAQSITSFQPESGGADTQVRIYGTGFDATASNNTVTFGGTEATLDSAKTNVLYAKVPSGVSGPVEIEVTTGGTTVTSTRQFSAVTAGDATFSDIGANLQGVGQGANAVADVNGDGRLDLLAGETLYYQQSDGSFEAAGVTLERGQDVSIADVNGDGLLDILVAGILPGGGVTLYEQQSDGTFAEAGVSLGNGSTASVADVNGDGTLDILLAGYTGFSTFTSLYLQQSDGSFNAADAGLTGISSGASSIADVNGDGLLDLLIAGEDPDNNDVAILYEQQSDGSFEAAQAGLEGVAGGSTSIADVDGDGDQDLLITGFGSGARRSILYLQQSDGSFDLANVGLTGVSSSASAIADVNGDGRSDLVIAGSDGTNSRATEVYVQQSDGSFDLATAGLVGVEDGDISVADVGGDGGLDLLVNGVVGDQSFDSEFTTTLYGSSDDLAPVAPTNLTAQPGDQQVDLSWDPNSDSDLAGYNLYRSTSSFSDTASATRVNSGLIETTNYADTGLSNGTTYYYRLTAVDDVGNQGSTSGEASGAPSKSAALAITKLQPTSGAAGTKVRVYGKGFSTTASENTVTFGGVSASIDSAKSNVLYTQVPSGAAGGPVEVSMSLEGGTATASERFSVVTGGGTFFGDVGAGLTGVERSASDIGDVDGDGDLDLLITGLDNRGDGNPRTTLYLQQSDGSFQAANAGLVDVYDGAALMEDVNGDGALDILVTGNDANFDATTALYLQQSDGSFKQADAGLLDVEFNSSAAIADVNSDGKLDILISGTNQSGTYRAVLYLQQASGGFEPANADLPGTTGSTSIADVNGDGRPDVLVTGFAGGGDLAWLYLQQPDGSFDRANAGLPEVGESSSAIADVNQDGRSDLLISGGAAFQSDTTGLFLQKPDGSFEAANAGLVGMSDGSVSIADVNGDGAPDLIVTGNRGSILYLQKSDGSFRRGFGLRGVRDGSVSIADVNGDGALNLLVAGSGDRSEGTARLYQNNFVGFTATATDDPSVDLTWDKVEGETLEGYQLYRATSPITGSPSEMDSLTALDASTTSYIDRNVSPGETYHYRLTVVDTAGTETEFSEEVSASPKQPPLRITTVRPSSGAAGTIVRIRGNGFSSTAADNTVAFDGVEATIDSAKRTVIYTKVPSGVNGGPASVSVSEGGETTTFTDRFSVVTDGGTSFGNLRAGLTGVDGSASTIGDVNDDGALDLLVAGYDETDTPTTTLYLQQSDGSLQAANAELTGVGQGSVSIADVNGDGRPDLLVTGDDANNNETATLYLQQSDGTFDPANAGLTGVSSSDASIGDVNGDGEPDLLITGFDGEGDSTTLYLQQEDGSFEAANAGLTPASSGETAIADVNGDGASDLLITRSDGFTIRTELYLQQSDGSFTEADANLTDAAGSLSIADVNGDGDLDVLITGNDRDDNLSATLHLQQSDGSFAEAGANLNPVTGGGTAIADVTGDGAPDLLITGYEDEDGNSTPNTTLYVQQDDGSFAEGGTGLPDRTSAVSVADVTANGALDLLLTGRDDNANPQTSLYGSGVDPSIAAPTGLTATATDAPSVDLGWSAVDDQDALLRYRLYRETAPITGSPSDLSPFDSTEAGTATFTDDPDPGQTYYYRVTAVDTAGVESGFSGEASAFLYPSEVTASASRTFGGATDSTGYRLVALPGQADRSISDAVSGEAGTAWQAYYDDGSDSGFLVEFDESEAETFTFQKGNGFWLTATSEWTFEESVPTADLRGDSATAIALRDGWNVISNPFDKDVDWAAVEEATGGGLQPIWAFDGTFGQAETFASAATGTAYYFLNDESSRDSLVIPYPGAPGGSGSKATPKAEEEKAPMLAVTATPVEAESAPGSTVRLGIRDGAEPGVGTEDLVAPPGRFAATSLRIEAPGEADSKRTRFLMAERRPPAKAGGHTFQLRLTNRTEGSVTVSVEELDAVEGRSVALLHPSAGETYDLREEKPVTIEAGGETTTLKVAIGSESYVENKTEEVLPKKVQLTSYPNPVGQQGTIEYALPEAQKVTLRVYDVLGRQVATLATGRKEAGRHTVRFETEQLSSGVYFGRLQSGEQTLTQKITVVR